MDVLQELPDDQWPVLMQKVKAAHWPLNVGGYYALKQNLKYPSFRELFQFKVFCPNGDVDVGFIAFTKRGAENSFIIYSTSDDTKQLENALVNTKLIDWKVQVVAMAPSTMIQLLQKLRPQLGLNAFQRWDAKMFYLDRSSKPFDNVKCPPNTYLAEIKQEHIPRVDSLWLYKYAESPKMFSLLASNGLSYGLYSSDNELLAWMFINEYNFLCHLFCEEKHRKKGYAEYVLKYVSNEQLAKGDDVFAYVVIKNEASQRLFSKLGFQHVDYSAWIELGTRNAKISTCGLFCVD